MLPINIRIFESVLTYIEVSNIFSASALMWSKSTPVKKILKSYLNRVYGGPQLSTFIILKKNFLSFCQLYMYFLIQNDVIQNVAINFAYNTWESSKLRTSIL